MVGKAVARDTIYWLSTVTGDNRVGNILKVQHVIILIDFVYTTGPWKESGGIITAHKHTVLFLGDGKEAPVITTYLGKVRISRSFLPKLTRWLKFRGSGPIFFPQTHRISLFRLFFPPFLAYYRLPDRVYRVRHQIIFLFSTKHKFPVVCQTKYMV